MIRMCESMDLAYKVLQALNKLVANLEGVDLGAFWVEAMSNGREQGYSVRSPRSTASFGQLRGSDAIVVYLGGSYDFQMQGNHPEPGRDIVTRTFSREEIDQAAEAIYEQMLEAYPIAVPA